MAQIRILDTFTANRIAAGEVVERPASIVKELVENAIDAGSTSIGVTIRNGGIDRIQVSDNGCGIEAEDMPLAFARHATSKIASPHDLDAIATLGFRGEALCSIAAVAQVELKSRRKGCDEGYRVRVAAGDVLEEGPIGCPDGTSLDVMHLFYNTPARLKFLKKPAIEAGAIGDIVLRSILAHPEIAFLYRVQSSEGADAKTVYHSAGDGDLRNAIFCVYGRETAEALHEIDFRGGREKSIGIRGYVSRSDAAKSTRQYQSFFVNGRYVQSPLLSRALQEAFGTRLMGGRFPLCALHIEIPFDAVDVNIHPHKTAVRFKDETAVAQAMRSAIADALGERAAIPWRAPSERSTPAFKSRMPSMRDDADVPQVKASWTVVPEDTPRTETVAQSTAMAPERPKRPAIDDAALRKLGLPEEDPSGLPTIAIEAKRGPQYARESTGVLPPDFGLLRDLPAPLSILGQAFGTYVIAEQGEALYLVDQHAAHERMVYDACLKANGKSAAQRLLIPQEVTLEPTMFAVWSENRALLEAIGFRFDGCDAPNAVSLAALPQFFGASESTSFLLEALEAIAAGQDAENAPSKRERLAEYACKHAVRAKEVLREDDMRTLLARFDELGEWHCPHGRPIVVRLTKNEIEKMFRRKL